jgi:hypothetical protein
VILNPGTYRCTSHNTDLTTLVREQLEDDPRARSAYGGRDRLPGRTLSGAREFTVIVSCPGAGTTHKVTCRGTVAP